MMIETKRPAWATASPAMQDYYDHHWGLPVHDEHELFWMLSLEIFQTGLRWQLVWKKREDLARGLADFKIDRLAEFTADDLERLVNEPTMIKNRQKITAVIKNARVVADWHQKGRSLANFTWQLTNGHPVRLVPGADGQVPARTPLANAASKVFKAAGFHFTGPVVMMSYLTAVGVINARV